MIRRVRMRLCAAAGRSHRLPSVAAATGVIRALICSIVPVLYAGCSLIYRADIERQQCIDQAECATASEELGVALVCRANACQETTCARNADCPPSTTCIDNTCVGTQAGAQTQAACVMDADCGAGNRCGFDGFCYLMWGCLDVDRERPVAPATIRYSTLARNIEAPDDPTRVGDLTVLGCSVIDPACVAPNVPRENVTVSPNKLIEAVFQNVPSTGFIGSLRVDAQPDPSGVMMPSFVHFPADTPLYADFYAQTPLLLIRAELFGLLAGVAAVTLDPNATTIAVRVHDCGGRVAPGVAMAADSPGTTFVPLQSDRVPVVGGLATTEDGGALLVNAAANRPVALTFRDVESGRTLTNSALLNPQLGAINYLFWYPRQSAQQKWLVEARRRGLIP